jgi:hypothetical protein
LSLTTGLNTVEIAAQRTASVPPTRLNFHSLPQVLIRYPPIVPTRKILCAAALLMGAIGAAPTNAHPAELHQLDQQPIVKVDAVGEWLQLRHRLRAARLPDPPPPLRLSSRSWAGAT